MLDVLLSLAIMESSSDLSARAMLDMTTSLAMLVFPLYLLVEEIMPQYAIVGYDRCLFGWSQI